MDETPIASIIHDDGTVTFIGEKDIEYDECGNATRDFDTVIPVVGAFFNPRDQNTVKYEKIALGFLLKRQKNVKTRTPQLKLSFREKEFLKKNNVWLRQNDTGFMTSLDFLHLLKFVWPVVEKKFYELWNFELPPYRSILSFDSHNGHLDTKEMLARDKRPRAGDQSLITSYFSRGGNERVKNIETVESGGTLKKFYRDNKIVVLVIDGGITLLKQPVDLSGNQTIKNEYEALCDKFLELEYKKQDAAEERGKKYKLKAPSREKKVLNIVKAFINSPIDKFATGFEIGGYTLPLDGSEDHRISHKQYFNEQRTLKGEETSTDIEFDDEEDLEVLNVF